MKKLMLVFLFLAAVAVTSFADEDKKPDTVFQKVGDYTEKGYKKDVEPIKQMSLFQIAADWVNGSSEEKKDK